MNSKTQIYNGKSIREIIGNLPRTFSKSERNYYIKNCLEVYKYSLNNSNTGLKELIRNSNFMLINNHLK